MKMRYLLLYKIVFYMMCLIIVVTLLRSNEKSGFKYILLWTGSDGVPVTDMGEGQSVFISRKCPYTNCIVTANRSLLGDYTLFDVVAFHGIKLFNIAIIYDFPKRRSPHQKYVYINIESPSNYPVCTHYFDRYFNWTWTYKLDSDLRWGYFLIRDSTGNIIGPKKDMQWISWQSMLKVDAKTKEKLNSKTKAVAWFVSNCYTYSQREKYVMALQAYLRGKYNIEIDIYGECGLLNCSPDMEEECNKLIEKDYHFYLSFENALSEDYVTEKLLIPLQYNAIPIVYGGANYSRFLPRGSYLNARELGVNHLSDKIYELIKNPDRYVDYFKWKNHYSYHKMPETPETDEFCKICALLNDQDKVAQITIYEKFSQWWGTQNCNHGR